MRRIILVVSLVAMLAVYTVPALAQSQEFEIEEAESGDAEPELVIENTGNSSNLTFGGLQSSNTGNVQNIQGVNQFGVEESDDIELEGSSIVQGGELELGSDQSIQQAVAVR